MDETLLKHFASVSKTFHPLYPAICHCLKWFINANYDHTNTKSGEEGEGAAKKSRWYKEMVLPKGGGGGPEVWYESAANFWKT